MSEQREILEELHKILSCNVIGDIAYKRRYTGFYGELDFRESFYSAQASNKISPKVQLFDGGYFLPKNNSKFSSLEDSVYVTISMDEPDGDYLYLAKKMSAISQDIFFICFTPPNSIADWQMSDPMNCKVMIRTPQLLCFKYDSKLNTFTQCNLTNLKELFSRSSKRKQYQKKIPEETKNRHIEKLSSFNRDLLLSLYVERYVFDSFIGFLDAKRSDIDAISLSEEGKYSFLEVKEKDKSRGINGGFGMDLPRIDDMMRITTETGIAYRYIVRQVDDQEQRKFVSWWSIEMKKFYTLTTGRGNIDGGHGMRSKGTSNPTKVCPIKHFTRFDALNPPSTT